MKTIEEKNRIIAEFMNVDQVDIDTYFETNGELKYHTSWEWLMPVLKKIRGIEEGMLVERIDFMPNDGIAIHIIGADSVIVDADGSIDGDKVATHNAVVQFIEWYNENK